ncbi:hypothetical protein V6N13_075623 [Hibiscus sabdariffa]|uniref:SAP domain-containing protein n=1 Tax=Hibiscus sabdariffa TaxID=183260 RepID=A0ABR2UC44_9ROSI
MDFHGMKRKELQALCKKHGVPANLTNREMADRLASIFKENEDPVPLEELSSNPEEIYIEDKANAVEKQVKKVRFSPDNQTMEYEVSVYQQPRRRSRRQTLSINPAQALENALTEDIKKFEGCQSRVTRPRVQNAVEEEMHTVSSLPVGRKRGRGGKRNKDAEEVANIGDSNSLELGLKDVENGHDKVTSGLSGRQLRSRKNVTPEDSKKIGNDKGGDKVHLLDGIYEGKNGPKQSMKNARKDQCVAFSSDVEKVEVVSRMTRQSRAQSKDVASMVKNEVKIVEVNDGNEIEKPLRRTKRNSGKDCAKTITSVKSDTQTKKVQEQSEIDIAFVKPPECLRRHSSRLKSVVSQSCKGANKEEFPKEETRKRSRTTELEAIVEDSSEVERDKYDASSQQQAPLRRSRRRTVVLTAPAAKLANKENIGGMEHLRAPLLGKSSNDKLDAIVEDNSEVERAKYAVTSQHQAPSRRGRRKTVILTSPAAKLANKEYIGGTEQLRAPLLGKGTTEELLRKSSQNSSRYILSGSSKEDQISVVESDRGAKQQMQEPILEEETFAREQHPVTQKRQRRSRRISSISASVVPPNATGKGVEKKQQSKSRMKTVEEEAAPTENLPSPGELPAGKDALFVVSECAGNKTNLDLDVSKQVVKSGDAPPFLNTEKDKDSSGNMEETLTESSVQLVGPSADQEMKQTAQKSRALYEKESNLVEENVEKLVKSGNFESEVNCMSSQTGKTTCVFKDANWSDPKRLKCESKGSHRADSSMITVPAEIHGNEESGQEMMVEFIESEQDNGLQFADKKDLTAATSTFLLLEKELGTELPGGEDTNFRSDNVTSACSITPFGEAQIVVNLKDTNVAAAQSFKEEDFKLNKSSESIGLKSELEILKKAEEMIAIDVSNTEGIPHIECSVEAAENQESSAQSHSTTAETDAQKISEVMQSSHSNTVAPGNESCIHESVLMYKDATGLVKNAEKIRMHEDYFESESSPSMNRTNANDDSNLVESRMVSFESSNCKVVSPEIASLADIFSSASRGGHAGKTSSRIELKKVLEIQETSENINPINYSMDDEVIRTPVVEDPIEGKLETANMTIVNTVEQVIFNDLLNELGENIVLKRGSEIPLKTSEKVSATMFSNGNGIVLTESSVKAEKQEYITEIDVAAAMNGTPNTTEIKCRSSSDTATHGTSVGLTPQSQVQDKLCSAEITDSITGSEMCNEDAFIFLMEDEKVKWLQNDTIKGEINNLPFLFLNKTGSLDDALVEVANNATRVVSSGMTYLADVYSSVNQINFAGETSNELKLEKVLDSEESSKTGNVVNNRLDKIEIKEDASCAQVVQSSLHLEDTDITAAEPIQEVIIWENEKTEVKEVSGLSQEDQSSVHSEDNNITAAEPVQEVVIWESDKRELKEDTGLAQEDQSLMHAEDTNITAAEPVQAVVSSENDKRELKEGTSLAQEDQSSMHLEDTSMTAAEPVQELVFRESDKTEVKEDAGLAQEDQSSLYSEDTNITAAEAIQEEVFWESDKTEVKEDTGLARENQSSMHLEDNSKTAAESVQKVVLWESDEMEVKEDTNLAQEDQSSMHLEDTNTTAESVQEVVFWESDKIEFDEDTSLAQEDQNSIQLEATNITAAGPVQEVVFQESDEMEVKEDTRLAQEDQNSMHLEDTNITAAESVQEVVFWDHLNKVCESGGTEESRDSLKKAEETGTSDSSAIGMVQTESSVETNEMSEATGQTTIMAMRWSLSSHDKELISPLRPQVASQDYQGTTYRAETDVSTGGCAMPGQLNNEDNAKIVENEGTINTEKEFYVGGKNVTLQSSKGKSRADGVYHPLSESIGSQCTIVKRMDISDGSFNNVSGETQEKHICEVFDGEGTCPISPEEKGIWDEKLPNNSFQHAINDMQEKSEAVCMDTRNRIPANILPQLALEQLDNESETSKKGFETGEVNARAFCNVTQALPPEELTTPISSESFSMSPLDHALVDNASGERVVHHSFIKDFAATMDGNGISVSGETDVVHEDNMAGQIATSPLNVELTDYSGGNVDAELYDPNMSVTDPIFQETDTFGVPSTECPEVLSNEPVAMDAENYGDLDDQDEEVGLETGRSSSFRVDALTSTVGVTVDNSSVVGPLESTLNISYPQPGTKVDDPDINNSDGGKAPVSYQRSLHGEHEGVSSSADTPCSKLEISIDKEHPQAMDDINYMVGTKTSTECKVIREEMDVCQTKSVGFNDVTEDSFEDESKIGLEELVGAKSDDFEGSMKTDTDLDGSDISDVNQTPCLDERKNCNLETEEPNALPFPETIAGDSREAESCSKLNIVSSIPFLENPDESTIFTNMEMRMFSGVEDEVKKSDARAGDTNDVALDMAITECNSRDTKEGDHFAKSDVEDTNFCVRKDGPEETMVWRNDFSELDAAMADKSPFSKSSEIDKVADGEEAAFRTELNLLNASAKMGRSNSVAVKQLVSSVMKSKSKPGLIPRTPKRPIFHDMKENEGSTKREKIGNRTTPKTASKLRPPLHRI